MHHTNNVVFEMFICALERNKTHSNYSNIRKQCHKNDRRAMYETLDSGAILEIDRPRFLVRSHFTQKHAHTQSIDNTFSQPITNIQVVISGGKHTHIHNIMMTNPSTARADRTVDRAYHIRIYRIQCTRKSARVRSYTMSLYLLFQFAPDGAIICHEP